MTILTDEVDVRKIKNCAEVIKAVFFQIEKILKEGISTAELDECAEMIIRKCGAQAAFKGYRGYPAVICASVNEVVVHGVPSSDVVLADGDIIGIDVGVKKNGYFTDAARTFMIGLASKEAKRLVGTVRESLGKGLEQAIAGNRVTDISNAIQAVAKREGFKEVRQFVGHGVGIQLHESPEVPNWGEKGKGPLLKEGLVLAVEPMFNAGTRDVEVLSDGWTAVTKDGKLSAHFEETIIVGREKAEIIT
ncbi:MAG: type I methionyl aminopeptidase [Candidatus Omnitrophota bacterium]